MGLMDTWGSNLAQKLRTNRQDDSNVHALNITMAASTAPAQGPSRISVPPGAQLANVTSLQQGPNISVDVSGSASIALCICASSSTALSCTIKDCLRSMCHAPRPNWFFAVDVQQAVQGTP